MGSYLSHSAHVESDRRQDPAWPRAASEPLVECCPLREYPWTYNVTDPISRTSLPAAVRFHRAPPQTALLCRREERDRTRLKIRGGFLSGTILHASCRGDRSQH